MLMAADGSLMHAEDEAAARAAGLPIAATSNGDQLLAPAVCSPWQMRKALNAAGLRSTVEAAVAASADQTMIDGWEFATEFRSDDPMVLAMGASIGKTPAETRDLIDMARAL